MRKLWKLQGTRDGAPFERYFNTRSEAEAGRDIFDPKGVIISVDAPDEPSDDHEAERARFEQAMRIGAENRQKIQESIEALHAHHAQHYRGEK